MCVVRAVRRRQRATTLAHGAARQPQCGSGYHTATTLWAWQGGQCGSTTATHIRAAERVARASQPYGHRIRCAERRRAQIRCLRPGAASCTNGGKTHLERESVAAGTAAAGASLLCMHPGRSGDTIRVPGRGCACTELRCAVAGVRTLMCVDMAKNAHLGGAEVCRPAPAGRASAYTTTPGALQATITARRRARAVRARALTVPRSARSARTTPSVVAVW